MNIKPLADRVLLKEMPTETITTSGFIIPNASLEKPNKGTVIAIGVSKMTVKVGDIVLYGKFAGMEIQDEENKYLLMRESDIVAIV